MLYPKLELDATQKSCMKQSFSVGYMVNHDTSFMLYTTKLHSVAQSLDTILKISMVATVIKKFKINLVGQNYVHVYVILSRNEKNIWYNGITIAYR